MLCYWLNNMLGKRLDNRVGERLVEGLGEALRKEGGKNEAVFHKINQGCFPS